MNSNHGGAPKRSAYDAFRDVDELVAKDVVGSDGAASWQNFKQTQQSAKHRASSAPMAPLKASDRAAGFSSWASERKNEESIRQKEGEKALGESGYTVFKRKGNQQQQQKSKGKVDTTMDAKEEDPKLSMIPEGVTYFIPSDVFTGWRHDYVFTTRGGTETGYYWDGNDTKKGIAAPFVQHEEDSTEQKPPKKKKKKSKGRQGPVIVEDPTNPREQLRAVLNQRTDQHQLPTGWESAIDLQSQKTYFFNRSTGEKAWSLPKSSSGEQGKQAKPKTYATLPQGWRVTKHESTGKEYYYNEETSETRWERPRS